MNSIQKSNTNLKLFKTTTQAVFALGCISQDTFDVLSDRLSFLKRMVDEFDIKGDAKELKTLFLNHKTAFDILCDIDSKIHRGILFKYEY